MALGSMVGGKPLFLDKSALPFSKEAAVKADRDPSKWESNIMMLLHEQHPYLQDYSIRLHMNRSDPEAGTAVGQLVLNDKVAIPVVIDGFKIQPFDVFWSDGKLRPMTKATLLSQIQDTGVGKSIEPGQGEMADMSIYNVTRAPFSGKYSFASGLTFSLDDYTKALNALGRDGLEYALKTNGTFAKTAEAFAAGAQEKILPGRTIEKTASGWKIEPIDFKAYEPVKEPGAYSVVFDGFRKEAAMVFDVLLGWDGQIMEGKKFVVSLEKNASVALADEVGARPLSLENLGNFATDAKQGEVGFFWMLKLGHAFATWPARFLYWGTDEEGLPFAKVADLTVDGMERTIRFSPDCQSVAMMGDTVLMSPEWTWHRCGDTVKVATAAEANKFDWPSDGAEIRNRGLVYSLHGAEIDGIAKTGESSLTFRKAMERKFDPVTVSGLMKTASLVGSSFCRVTKPAEGMKKLGSADLANFDLKPVNLFAEAAHVKPCDFGPFCKVAVAVTDEQAQNTVDSILGLNFINDANIYKFLDHTDELEEASAVLAKLLLASKMGFQVEAAPLKTALFALDNVIRQMKQLRSTTGGIGAE
jgi:hypothetical protein